MSIFRSSTLKCPACGTDVAFDAVYSVNVDRRPDLRSDIVDETFQQMACPNCGAEFRLDPEFNLLDTQRGQWVAAAPLSQLRHWKAMEERAQALFDQSWGPQANDVAQSIGKGLQPRVTFGWPALREKLIANDHELDDVTLELCKAAIMRSVDSPIGARSELRLTDVADDGQLVFTWLLAEDGTPGPAMNVERALYDEIAADDSGDWDELRDDLAAAYFVDINRLLIDPEPLTEAAEGQDLS